MKLLYKIVDDLLKRKTKSDCNRDISVYIRYNSILLIIHYFSLTKYNAFTYRKSYII